jgi:cell division protein FtsL
MLMPKKIVQAYKEAPWRKQAQRIVSVLLAVIIIGLVAGMDLYISSQSAEAGLTIWQYENNITQSQKEINRRQTELAILTSVSRMEEKAHDMGYREMNRNTAKYILVPGYYGRKAAELSELTIGIKSEERILIRPSYTQSLWDWMKVNITAAIEQSETLEGEG